MQAMKLSNALFTLTQQRVLALLFGKPDQSFYTNEIARWSNVGKGGLVRELERMQQAGIVTVSRQGNQTHYQANPDCPIYTELLSITRKTFGIREPLRTALEPFAAQVTWAFVYGSIAKNTDRANSDIDLMLIGENLRYSDLMGHLIPVEQLLGRTINPTLYTLADWQARKVAGNSFVVRVDQQEKINLIGGPQQEPSHDE